MMPEYPREAPLQLSQLNLDRNNYRLGSFVSQRETLEAMVQDQEKSLVNLADDILELGLDPTEYVIVAPDEEEDGMYVVLDGNRRVTALKLLRNPRLAAGSGIERRFVDLARDPRGPGPSELPCMIFESKQAAKPWIDRKHSTALEGRGREKWGAEGTTRANADNGVVRPWYAVREFLREAGESVDWIDDGLHRKTTTADRLFNSKAFKEGLGVRIDGADIIFANGNEDAGKRLLLAILEKMVEPEFSVTVVETTDDRWNWIEQFRDLAVHPPDEETGEGEGEGEGDDDQDNGTDGRGRRRRRTNLDRATLASRRQADALAIDDERLHRLFEEAKRLQVKNFPGTSSVLTRVFLELTVDHYIDEFSVPAPGGRPWRDVKLKEKVKAVMRHLDPANNDQRLVQPRRGVGGPDHLHSIESLHSFVHDAAADPNGTEIKQIWDRWHPLFQWAFESIDRS